MKIIIRRLLLLTVLMASLAYAGFGQAGPGPVGITFTIIPPYSPRLSDYGEQPGKVILLLRNNWQTTLEVYLRITITGDNGVVISTSPNYRPARPITLTMGQVVQADLTVLRDLFNENNLVYKGISPADITRKNGLPEGNYEICVQAIGFDSNQPVSAGPPSGCRTIRIASLEPPLLIRPFEDEALRAFQPQNIIFSWTIPAATEPGTQYQLRIVELLDAKRNINDAFNSATTPPFFETPVRGNVFVYGPAQPPMVPGRKYAWAVTALDRSGIAGQPQATGANFRNNGRSEVRGFVYGADDTVQGKTSQGANQQYKGATGGFTPINAFFPLNKNIFKGKLVWAFRKTEDPKPLPPTAPSANDGSGNASLAGLISSTNYSLLEESAAGSASGNFTSFGSGTTRPGAVSSQGGAKLIHLPSERIKTMSEQERKKMAIDALADGRHFPLANVSVNLYLHIQKPAGSKNNPGGVAHGSTQLIDITQFVGTAKTNENGEFELDYYGDQLDYAQDLTLVVKTPYFEYATKGMPVNKGQNGTYDFGEILGLAKAYRLKINVTDQDGNRLNNVRVEVRRPASFYDADKANKALEHEVMRDDPGLGADSSGGDNNPTKTIRTGTGSTLAGKGPEGTTFKRIFTNDNFSDKYLVRISGENAKTKTFDFIGRGYPGKIIDGDVPTVEKTYRLTLNEPSLKGRVLVKDGELPVENVHALLVQKHDENLSLAGILANLIAGRPSRFYFATTNKDGRFNIENIRTDPEPYVLKLIYNRQEFKEGKPVYFTNKGMKEERDPIYIRAELITVCGSVKDAKGNPLANATLHWKSGGESFNSNGNGLFVSRQTEGKHILVAQMPGYKDAELEIEVVRDKNSTASRNDPRLNKLPAAVKGAAAGFTGIKSSSFENGVKAENAFSSKLFGAGAIVNSSGSCDHVISMKRFYVKATVTDSVTRLPVSQATVQVEYDDSSRVTTGAGGTCFVPNVPTPAATLIVKGPDNAMYVPVKTVVSIDNSRDTMEIQVALRAGSRVSGKVTSKSLPVKDALVSVDGLDYINVKTDASGAYTLSGVPAGQYDIRAGKTGLLGKDTLLTTASNKSFVADFSLTDPGFDASKLLGFDIMLYKSEQLSPDRFRISGEVVNIPDNPVFRKQAPNLTLPFTDLIIKKSGAATVPESGEIKFDASEIALKVFNWAVVRLRNSSGLVARPLGGDNSRGEIIGDVLLDAGSTFGAITSWKLPSVPIKLLDNAPMVGALNSTGTLSTASFRLDGPATDWQVYNVKFSPDLVNSHLSDQGLTFRGDLSVEGVPGIGSFGVKMKNMLVTKSGQVRDIDLDLNPQPTISIASWQLKLEGAGLDAYGFRFSGNMDVPIPSSPAGKIGFSNLGISTSSGLTGGDFYLPDAGLNIFDIVQMKSGSESFSLRKLPMSSVYQFTGGGTISFMNGKFISQELTLDNFSIRSDGNFSAKAQTDLSVDFAGMASLAIDKVGISTAPAGFDIGGKFKLNIPNFGVGAGGEVHYRKGAVSVDRLAIGFDLGSVISMNANVAFRDDELSGGGYLKLAGLVDGIGLQFLYKKLPGGTLVKADFKTGVIIPIGIVKLDNVGGGFSCNTATSTYSVNASGRITFAADPVGVLALNPVGVSITSTPSGPIFEGGAKAVLMNSWQVGDVSMKIDFGRKYFFIDGKFGGGFSIMKGFNVDANAGLHIEASAGSDSYWMFAGYSHVRIPYIIDNGVTLAGGWNVPKSVHASLSGVPDYALNNGRLYGGYFGTYCSIGAHPPAIGVKGIADVRAWYQNDGNAEIYANVKSGAYGVKFASNWNAGAEARFLGIGVAGASLGINGQLEGYYNNGGWGINGSFGADLNAHIGCDGGCNGVTWGCCFNACVLGCRVCPCPCGAKICASGRANIGYNAGSGFNAGLSIF